MKKMKKKTRAGNLDARELHHRWNSRRFRSAIKRSCNRRERVALKARLRREVEEFLALDER